MAYRTDSKSLGGTKACQKTSHIAAPDTVVSGQPQSPAKQLMKRPEIEAGEDEGSYIRAVCCSYPRRIQEKEA